MKAIALQWNDVNYGNPLTVEDYGLNRFKKWQSNENSELLMNEMLS